MATNLPSAPPLSARERIDFGAFENKRTTADIFAQQFSCVVPEELLQSGAAKPRRPRAAPGAAKPSLAELKRDLEENTAAKPFENRFALFLVSLYYEALDVHELDALLSLFFADTERFFLFFLNCVYTSLGPSHFSIGFSKNIKNVPITNRIVRIFHQTTLQVDNRDKYSLNFLLPHKKTANLIEDDDNGDDDANNNNDD